MNRFHRWFCKSSYWRKALGEALIPWALQGVDLGGNILEIGPGPGLTTDILRRRFNCVTALEIDPELARSLKRRLHGTNARVVEGDATRMPFENNSFSGAVSFTMLHHVPSTALQDQLLAEVYRVLKPGGVFAGTDSRWGVGFQLFHLLDTLVVVDPKSIGKRLEIAGFREVEVSMDKRAFRFRAKRPARDEISTIERGR
ncbi:MAG: class I SAM-dependent methyltransferase [Acidobacteria bacterium]|nr:class I SAM-dependent methyltransferase [Acidobacteriota bacterium]